MARYNTAKPIGTVTGTTTITAPGSGEVTTLTGVAPYTVTLPSPVLYLGLTQTFYNSTSGSITLSTPVGGFVGPTVSGSSMVMPVGSVAVLASNGVNYILADFFGGAISAQGTVTLSPAGTTVTISPTGTGANLTMSPAGTGALTPVGALTLGTAGQTETHRGNIVATTSNQTVTLSPTGTGTVTISPAGALTINPTAASTINNTSIGASTRSTGAFTSLTANAAVTLTQNAASSNTTSGTLVVTGGVGVSGAIYAGSIQNTPIGTTSRNTGAFTTLTANAAVTLTQNTGSTTTTSGTLVVTGGVGISQNLYVGGTFNSTGVITATAAINANGGTTGIIGYTNQTATATLADIDRKYIVSNTAAITLTLPATTTDGRTIILADGNNFGSFNVTVARGSSTIGGLAENLVLNVPGSYVELVYRGGDWKVFTF